MISVKKKLTVLRGAFYFVPVLLVIYAMSIGPVFGYLLAQDDDIPHSFGQFVDNFYAPLKWIINQSDALSDLFGSYIKICMELF
ncbi:hypothetical protein Pan153_29130 [Gimesia panareensis]|uniref:ABC-2 family transporter protein n=1 Tax=Gimesia panareensis TaxID=2527978 RepID=A0A518FPH8_9PLAN|nr:hypothetical protein Pan153_29130 [Gimesia panareensis]